MDYTEINGSKGFKRNMRRTPWLKLFPHWWSENDALLNAIGDEVERIKSLAFFTLLNTGIKPPVMVWQNSIVHEKYHIKRHLTQLESYIDIQAPLYKTWGKIVLTNNTKDEINTLQIMVTEFDGILIEETIKQEDIIVIDLLEQKVTINGKKHQFFNLNEGMPYFKTVQNLAEYDENTPLHNEVIRLCIKSKKDIKCNIDVDIQLDNVVFTDEQNIEVTGLELIPIEKVELYVKHDFEFNPDYNGWHKVYQKKYDKNTNVLYDMITTQFYTKEFYVQVFFKELQYPYKVGFPCYKDAEEGSMYHVNNRLDTWGEQLGLKRRNYKENIPEENYATTYPPYYPFDIEQDYWYYKRLTNEYTWNHLATNDIDIKDTENNNVIRLYSINPFVEDFVVHTQSRYSEDKEYKNYRKFTPVLVSQQNTKKRTQQVSYINAKNILTYDDRKTKVTLLSHNGNNINQLKYQSKELWSFFDLSELPEDINIDNIEILVEADSNDNKTDKYSTDQTGLIMQSIDGNNTTFIPLYADKSYQLSEQLITYSSEELLKYIKDHYRYQDKNINQVATIGYFQSKLLNKKMTIPFKLEENGEFVTDITNVWVYYNNRIQSATYKYIKEQNLSYIEVGVPNVPNATKMTIVCKSKTHAPFTGIIDIGTEFKYVEDKYNYVYERNHNKFYKIENDEVYEVTYLRDENGDLYVDGNGNYVEIKREFVPSTKEKVINYVVLHGPYSNGVLSKDESMVIVDDWKTKDLRNVLQKQGLFFRNVFENSNEQSETTINIKNITLKISYSDKQSWFTMDTKVDTDVLPPRIGKYELALTNKGEKNLSTHVDIINAPNIQLDKNYIEIKDLKINDTYTETIDIYPQSPIDDGYYDILTVCENKERKNKIGVFNTGLIGTGVKLSSHHGKYDQPITLKAYFTASGQKLTNSNQINFYVNNYLINQPITLENNVASITFNPQDYSFINTGIMPIDVKYSGDEKYAGCSARNELFISKSSTKVKIDFNKNVIPFASNQTFKATVTYIDEDGDEQTVNDGEVSFYLDDTPLGKVSSTTGVFELLDVPIDISPGYYTLWARYGNSDTYATDEDFKEIRVAGGTVHINVFDVEASPVDTIDFKAKVTDDNNDIVESGCIKFKVQYKDLIDIEAIGEIHDGIATATQDINIDIGNKGTINTQIHANLYESDECVSNGYVAAEEDALGIISISKKEIDFIYDEQYFGTKYEPLGFLIDVIDKKTQAPVDDGTLTLSIVGQDFSANTNVVDGKARIIFNPMIFFENWDKTGEYNLFISGDESTYQLTRNGEVINLYALAEGELIDGDLYLIAKNDVGEQMPFCIDDNGELQYIDYTIEEEDMIDGDNFFYLQDRKLYRTSSVQANERAYRIGTYEIKIQYSNSQKYSNKTKYIEDGLIINESDVNLDLHTYNELTYTNQYPITCYATYNSGNEVTGTVDFYIDNEKLYTSSIENKQAIIPIQVIKDIKAGTHLLQGVYSTENGNAYTYSLITIEKITPAIDVTVDTKLKGHDSTVHVEIKTDDPTIPISGYVSIYLNNQLLETLYLYGNEGMQGIVNAKYEFEDIGTIAGYHNDIDFVIKMPDDLDINDYELKIVYEGNNLIKTFEHTEIIHQEPVEIELSCEPTTIAVGAECLIPIKVEAERDADLHKISEGYVAVIHNGEIIAQFNVKNNIANVRWTIEDDDYKFKYISTPSYIDKEEDIDKIYTLSDFNITVLDAQQDVIVYNENDYASLKDAIQCLNDNGILIIEGEQTLNTPFEIKKSIKIEGRNDAVINLTSDFILNSDIEIYNVKIVSENNSNIINKNKLRIIHSILETNIQSPGELTVNRCLVYSKISAINPDLNNNWWGQNDCPYTVDNNIILTIDTDNTPAVIVDDVKILGRLIGANGVQYSIPSVDFKLVADTGYFSIDSGKTVNEEVRSTYMDATEEGKIYLTVDNQTVECNIYDYERKTEIIIQPLCDIPLNQYVELKANIRSCTDNYYTNSDMNGYVDWYIDGQQIAHSYIIDNYSSISTYMNDYSEGEHTIKAVYKPYEYYFGCEQEIKVNTITADKVKYVSPNGFDTEIGHGTFDAPYATISKALKDINEDGYTIYLKDGQYGETNINVNYITTIKAYNDNAIFSDTTGEYIFNNTKDLYIHNIDFVNNQVNYLFNNSAHVYINQSLIKNNNEICNNNNYDIEYSAILENELNNEGNNVNCWFGENRDVELQVDSSKDVLYDGVVALLTAKLVHADDTKLEKPLPSRIAQFLSDDYQFRPIEDYTYNNNKASSLLNTCLESNKTKPVLTVLDTTQYVNHPISIRCHVQDGLRNNLNGTINFKLKKGDKIFASQDVETENGYATLTTSSLRIGEYELICSFESSITSANITVKKQDIIIEDFELLTSNNHRTQFKCKCIDGLNQLINNVSIDVLIDGNKIGEALIEEGYINALFDHDFLRAGAHQLTLFHNEDSYDTMEYNKKLLIKEANTSIEFEDTKISKNVETDLTITVKDEYGKPVEYGTVTIFFDGDIIYENQTLTNGVYIIEKFKIEQQGQHSLIVVYNGSSNAYNSSSEKYTISTDIYNIDIRNLQNFNIELNDKIVIDHDVVDIASRFVSVGTVNIFFNGVQIGESIPIKTGHLSFRSSLPIGTTPGVYALKIYYEDTTDTYLDTVITKTVTINAMNTTINIDDINTYPNQNTQVPFSVTSKYGKINTGLIEVLYNDTSIYSGTVSDGLFNYITFTAPNLPAGVYDLKIKYTDTTGYYKNTEKDITLGIQRNNVVIETNYNSYYPQKPLIFNIDIRNKDGKRVNTGVVDIYIDGVKEKTNIPVQNGQASTTLIFNQAKIYKIDIVFKDEEYYLNTNFTQDFLVGRLNIEEIVPKYDENKTTITELVFDTIDDYNVTDGIVYIYIDDIQQGSYYIKEKDKIIDLDISYLTKGDHTVTIEYSASMVFEDYNNNYNLYIEPKQATIEIANPISIDVNSVLQLYGNMSEQIPGVISFKLDDKYIGSTTVNSSGEFLYEYELPITFTNEQYTITATFEGNPYYDTIVRNDIVLYLSKQDTDMSISLDTTTPSYQDTLSITINTELSNPSITLSIKDLDTDTIKDIGYTTTKSYGYMLDDNIITNENGYQIIATYQGSPLYNKTTITSETFNIVPSTPTADETNIISGYYNGEIILPYNIFLNPQYNSITSGKVIYHFIDDIEVTEQNLKYEIPEEYVQDTVSVSFISDNHNKYNDATGSIPLLLMKNNPILTVDAPEYFNLGDEISITITAKCDTTNHTIDKIIFKETEYSLTNNQTTIKYQTTESDDLLLIFSTPQDDTIFNYTEVTVRIPLNRGEYNEVTSSDNIQDIINATENGGTIVIADSISNKTLTIDKDLTIKGKEDNITFSDCVINHISNDLIIDKITFNNSTITSKDNITINNCQFNNNTNTSLDLSGETNIIKNTTFKNNNNICIKLNDKNIHTTIDSCIFNHNKGSLFGTCIQANKANELEILNTQFINNINTFNKGACIYSSGKMSINESLFYNNDMAYDIRFLKGDLIGDTCIFADVNENNEILLLEDTEYDLDYNYWGNHQDIIETDNYLIGTTVENENIANITITKAKYETEATTRNFERSYTVEVITDDD